MIKSFLDEIGEPACLEQLAEEAVELAHAALKLARLERGENPTPATRKDAEKNLIEEIADVRVCLNAISPALGGLDTYDLEQRKKIRWIRRLKGIRMVGENG